MEAMGEGDEPSELLSAEAAGIRGQGVEGPRGQVK